MFRRSIRSNQIHGRILNFFKHRYAVNLVAGLGFLILIVLPVCAVAQSTEGESIQSYNVSISVGGGGKILVVEDVTYDFGPNSRHGIYRDVPYRYNARGGNYNLRISDVSVTNVSGSDYPIKVTDEDDKKRIRIGDPDILVSGIKRYRISYTVTRAINYFEDSEELYWNAIGTEWEIPINNANIVIVLPQGVTSQSVKTACYAGPYGSQDTCETPIVSAGDSTERVGTSIRSLAPGEGVAIVLGFPKGTIAKPALLQQIIEIIQDNWVLVLPLITLVALWSLWWRRGRDPEGRGTIVAEFDPPDGLSPAEVGTILDERADNADISAEIIQLAVLGYLKIVRLERPGFIGKKIDYQLHLLRPFDDLKDKPQSELLKRLFLDHAEVEPGAIKQPKTGFQPRQVTLSQLKEVFYHDLQKIKDELYEAVVLKGYFSRSPKRTRGVYIGIAVAVAVLGIWIGVASQNFYLLGSLAASAVIIGIFGIIMPKKTGSGVVAHERILGLRAYLSVAEADRIKFHNAPEKSPQRFEKLLPYAMALGVEKEWAGQFKDLYERPPSWYSDSSHGVFNAILFTNSLRGFSIQANSTLASTPSRSSASGGGSGFGGGGFSGGGFGGGGGGSW